MHQYTANELLSLGSIWMLQQQQQQQQQQRS